MEESFLPGDAVELNLLHRDVPPPRFVFSCEVEPHGGRLRGKGFTVLLQLELELGVSVVRIPVKVDLIEALPYVVC